MGDTASAAIGAMFGAIFGTICTIWIEWTRHRRNMAVSLFEEFNMPEILQMRADAEQILDTHIRRKGLDHNPDTEITMWLLESNVSSSDYVKVLSFLHMFEKIVILYENDRADRKIMTELLGRTCRWWYQKYVRRMTAERPEMTELLKIVKRMKKIADLKEKLKEYD